MNGQLLLLGSVLLVLGTNTSARKIPNYVKVCKRNDPDLDNCILKSIDALRPRLAKGIPKMLVPPGEPFVIPALEVNRDLEAIKVRALITNIAAYGPSQFVIDRLKTDIEKRTLDLSITLPHLDVTANYDIDGRILLAPFKGKGVFKGNFTDVKATVKGHANLVKKNNEDYLEIDKVSTKIKIGDSNLKIAANNDANGAIAQATSAFYTQNKDQIFQIITPIVEETAGEVIFQYGNQIFGNMPYSEMLPV